MEEEFERQTEEKAELVPPIRRPPTAVGAGTSPPRPPRRPAPRPWLHPEPPRPPHRAGPPDLASLVRALVGAGTEAANALVDWLAKRLAKAAHTSS